MFLKSCDFRGSKQVYSALLFAVVTEQTSFCSCWGCDRACCGQLWQMEYPTRPFTLESSRHDFCGFRTVGREPGCRKGPSRPKHFFQELTFSGTSYSLWCAVRLQAYPFCWATKCEPGTTGPSSPWKQKGRNLDGFGAIGFREMDSTCRW